MAGLQAVVGIALAVMVVGGLLVSRWVVARVATVTIRRAILWWAAVGGVTAIVRVVAS